MARRGGTVVRSPRAQQALFALPAFRHLGEAERAQAADFFREVALGKDETVYRDLKEYWVLDFWKAAPMIAQGRKAAEAALPAIREKLATLRGEDA